jgi:uncharacterized membrane protein YfhO
MGRYQELYDFHIAKRNPEVLNMLNTKYVIVPDEKGAPTLAVNSNANGNAWFVNELKFVVSADEEIKALDSLNTKTIVVLSSRYTSDYKNDYPKDSLAQISLTDYKANAISYQSNSKSEQFAVFSEMYYKDGWNSYIDGKLTKHFRVNYVLRGMEIPAGNHTIEFKFEPKVIKTGSTIALASYALLFLIPIGWFLFKRKKKKYESTR